MYIEGDIFYIDNKEYRLRLINKYGTCWLEPVLFRDEVDCITGGLNKIYEFDELNNLKYMDVCY